MKHVLIASVVGLCLVSSLQAEELLREVSWAELKAAGKLVPGEVETGQVPAPSEQLRIANPTGKTKTVTVLTISDPGITHSVYAVRGQVRCENVEGTGFLEMWSHFPGGGRHFSRTLAPSGLLQSLEGSSGWRQFSLPFFGQDSPTPPRQLVVNVVLPGRGTVWLGPLRLVQYTEGENPLRLSGQWWDDRTAGWIGGVGGSVLGCLGALIGVLAGLGKGRRVVLGLSSAIVLAGLVLLAAGGIAVLLRQPYAVWYPLVLTGLLSTLIVGGMFRGLRRRYEELELRKMAALDLASGRPGPGSNP